MAAARFVLGAHSLAWSEPAVPRPQGTRIPAGSRRAGRAGVSHSPLEIIDAADIAVAVEALARALTSLA
jgi:hypothetical protein